MPIAPPFRLLCFQTCRPTEVCLPVHSLIRRTGWISHLQAVTVSAGRCASSRPARTPVHPPDTPEGPSPGYPLVLPTTASALLHQMPPPKGLQPYRLVRKRSCPIPVSFGEPTNTGFGGTARLQRGFEDLVQLSANERSFPAPCPSSDCFLFRPPTSPEGFIRRNVPPHNRPAFPSFTRQTAIPANVGSAANDRPTE